MLLHTNSDGEQRTEDWRQSRAGSITGTGFQSVLKFLKNGAESKERQDYRMQLISERVTGQPAPELMRVPALEWGKKNEPAGRIAYEMRKADQGENLYVDLVGFQQHPVLDWVGTSPDGLVGDHGMIEIKCPWNSANHLLTLIHASKVLSDALLGEKDVSLIPVPEEHLPQIQGNLWVLGRQWCDFISYDPRVPQHLQLYVARVQRDDVYIAKLEAACIKFLDEVESNVGMLILPEDLPTQREEEVTA